MADQARRTWYDGFACGMAASTRRAAAIKARPAFAGPSPVSELITICSYTAALSVNAESANHSSRSPIAYVRRESIRPDDVMPRSVRSRTTRDCAVRRRDAASDGGSVVLTTSPPDAVVV